jgi:hypothetical protein
MLHGKPIREAFNPEQITVIVQAFEKALAFVLRAGYGNDDPDVQDNLAAQIVEAGKELPELSLIEVANRAIARYRVYRERMLAIAAKHSKGRASQCRNPSSHNESKPRRIGTNGRGPNFELRKARERHVRM